METRSLLLFSGGIDSTVLAGLLQQARKKFTAFTISTILDSVETLTAKKIAQKMNFGLVVFDASSLAAIAILTNKEYAVGGQLGGCVTANGVYAPYSIETTHSVAEMFALCNDYDDILWAIHQDDVVDIEKLDRYLQLREEMVKLRTGKTLCIKAPLITMNKREVLEMGYYLELPVDETRSCSEKEGVPCGRCQQCLIRNEVMQSLVKIAS